MFLMPEQTQMILQYNTTADHLMPRVPRRHTVCSVFWQHNKHLKWNPWSIEINGILPLTSVEPDFNPAVVLYFPYN